MRIDLGNPNGITGARSKRETASPSSSKGTDKREGVRDTLSFSSAAQQVDDLREKTKDIPTVRDSEVKAVRSQIEAGSYRPDSSSVVDGLLREHLRHAVV